MPGDRRPRNSVASEAASAEGPFSNSAQRTFVSRVLPARLAFARPDLGSAVASINSSPYHGRQTKVQRATSQSPLLRSVRRPRNERKDLRLPSLERTPPLCRLSSVRHRRSQRRWQRLSGAARDPHICFDYQGASGVNLRLPCQAPLDSVPHFISDCPHSPGRCSGLLLRSSAPVSFIAAASLPRICWRDWITQQGPLQLTLTPP